MMEQQPFSRWLDQPVSALLSAHPESQSVFTENGIDTRGMDDVILAAVLARQGICPPLFLGRLGDAVEEAAAAAAARRSEADFARLDFIGKSAFFTKPLFTQRMESLFLRYNQDRPQVPLEFLLAKTGNHAMRDMAYLWYIRDIANFPAMVCAVGLSNLFRMDFRRRFLNGGCFENYELTAHTCFAGTDIADTKAARGFVPYAVSPWLMLCDRERLAGRPLPRCWEDLLNPIYCNSVMLEGSDTNIANVPTLYTYRDHGREGVWALAENTALLAHPVSMLRYFSQGQHPRAAIAVIPWTFAQGFPMDERYALVWPEDGAITVPMYFMVRRGCRERMAFATDYLLGPDYGQECADLYCPTLCPGVDNHLTGGKLKWLGWDFIYSEDKIDLSVYTRDLFAHCWKGEICG